MAMMQPPPPGAQPPGPPQLLTNGMPSIVGERGGLYPRWPFLAAMLLTPLAIAGYGFHLLDHLPGVLQTLIFWGAFLLLWLACLVFGLRPLETETPDPATAPIAHFFWRLSNFRRVRPLLVGYGLAALLFIIAAARLGRLAWGAALAWGVILIVVAFCALVWRPRPPAHTQSAQALWQQTVNQAATPWYVFRSLPVINRLFPPRAPQLPPNPVQPANAPVQPPRPPGP